MLGFLALGFLIGLRHALEADHVAAVASLATRGGTLRDHARQGALWGLGHTLTLLLLAGSCLLAGVTIPASAERTFEALVGVMLVALGLSVFRGLRQRRIHVHVHRHADGSVHVHAHAHEAGGEHDAEAHRHGHPHVHGLLHVHRPRSLRALGVGMVHGVAGSAALVLLVAGSAGSALWGLLYVLLFGLGSIVGMMVLAAVLSLPLSISARRRTGLYQGLCAATGAFSLVLGLILVGSFAVERLF
jgi:ABC-type nickel/cobalt efflux system permease component RcnA